MEGEPIGSVKRELVPRLSVEEALHRQRKSNRPQLPGRVQLKERHYRGQVQVEELLRRGKLLQAEKVVPPRPPVPLYACGHFLYRSMIVHTVL